MKPLARFIQAVAILMCATGMFGCGQQANRIVIPAHEVLAKEPRNVFRAGAARTDITPPVGYPTGGHGPAGSVARGYWGRLYARAFYFEGTNGRHVVLVSCDTFAIPGALLREVAYRVRDLGIYREEIVLAATHTHQGAGNYLSAWAYNAFGSNFPGFDKKIFGFLAGHIADAIRKAREDSETAGSIELKVGTGSVGDLVRNRAPDPFLLNRERDLVMEHLSPPGGSQAAVPCIRECPDRDRRDCEPPGGWEVEKGCPRLRAVDRNVTTLEVSRKSLQGSKTVGVLVFLAVHPTVLAHDSPFYSGDFVGVAMRRLETDLAPSSGAGPVAGFFNGPEGDVSPRRRWRDLREVIAFGRDLADAVHDTLRTGRPLELSADVHLAESDADTSEQRECFSKSWGRVELGRRPLFGAPGFGGGEGDRTAVFELGWKDGVLTEARSGQGPKLGGFDSKLFPDIQMTTTFAPRDAFPIQLPITLAKIGSFRLLSFPVELTTTMAYQIRKSLGDPPHGDLEIIGLASEYASYVTTAAEYGAQHYEGGSTLWGPNEGRYLACWLESRVLPLMEGGQVFKSPIQDVEFNPGVLPTKAFGPEFCGDRRASPDEGLDEVLLDEKKRPLRALPWFEWEEDLRTPSEDFRTLPGDAPRVSVVSETRGQWASLLNGGSDTDEGFGVITMLLDAADESKRSIDCGGAKTIWNDTVKEPAWVCDGVTSHISLDRPLRRRWAAIWLRPGMVDLSGQAFRFEVTTRWNGRRCSKPFKVGPLGDSEGRIGEIKDPDESGRCPFLGQPPSRESEK